MISFLIPFKGLRGAKTRWALDEQERQRVLLEILGQNLDTVASVAGAASTMLVCPDAELMARFPQVGHIVVPGQGLNPDLEVARRSLSEQRQGESLAVLLPDLPRLSPADVAAMMAAARQAQVVLCPDRAQVGTNGLVLSPAGALEFLFEGASFQRHRDRARGLGRSILVLQRAGLADDADEADDLRRLSRL
jgi:2-phospho-L-lactate guanylyltransferase